MLRKQTVEEYGSGNIIRKWRLAELIFLHVTLHIDLFYNLTKYHYLIVQIESCFGEKALFSIQPKAYAVSCKFEQRYLTSHYPLTKFWLPSVGDF